MFMYVLHLNYVLALPNAVKNINFLTKRPLFPLYSIVVLPISINFLNNTISIKLLQKTTVPP